MLITFLMLVLISLVLLFLTVVISKKNKYKEKLSPFECGFDMINSFRTPFSMKFFLIAILFLVFDIEITLFLPMLINMTFSKMTSWILTMGMFFFILIIGLLYEWFMGSLNWKN